MLETEEAVLEAEEAMFEAEEAVLEAEEAVLKMEELELETTELDDSEVDELVDEVAGLDTVGEIVLEPEGEEAGLVAEEEPVCP